MKRIFYAFVGLLFCSQAVMSQSIIQIDPERTPRGTLALSDMVESIEYIQLETNDNCLIADIRRNENVLVSDNYILVLCRTSESCYLFNRAGKFMAKIGNKGQGPGEYIMPFLFAIDEKNRQVIISTYTGWETGALMYYNLNGKYIRSVSVDRKLTTNAHAQVDNKWIVMEYNNIFREGDPPFTYSIYSDSNKLIAQRVKNIDYTVIQRGMVFGGIGSFSYYLFHGQLHTKSPVLNDTVYRVGKDLSFSPKYVIQGGKYSFTKQILSDVERSTRETNSHTTNFSVFETDNHVLISYIYREKNYCQYYDKTRRQSFLFNSVSGIPNDYDGGLDFMPKKQRENELIAWYDAELFAKNNNSLKPKGPQAAVERQKKFTDGVIEYQDNNRTEANPVIVIAKMKSLP